MTDILEQIYESSLSFLAPQTLPQTYASIVKEAMRLVGGEYGSIYLYKHGRLYREFSTAPPQNQVKHRRRGFLYNAYKKRSVSTLSKKEFIKIHPEFKDNSISSVIFVPLIFKGKTIGVLTLQSSKEKYFTPKKKKILKLFSSFAYLAIQKTLLYTHTKNALHARDLFIAMAAHELRTPLTTINGYAQLLHHKLTKKENPKLKWTRVLKHETIRLTKLVNELLQIDQIKRGQFQYNLIHSHLTQIISDALNEFRFSYPKYNIVIKDNLSLKNDIFIGDCDKILQAFSSILSNAADFSPAQKNISIETRKNSNSLFVTIRDQGKGILKKDLPHVFEEFYRGTNSSKEGMGLGLFLSKLIIDKHRGSIKLDSKPNVGTTVYVKLPLLKQDFNGQRPLKKI